MLNKCTILTKNILHFAVSQRFNFLLAISMEMDTDLSKAAFTLPIPSILLLYLKKKKKLGENLPLTKNCWNLLKY